MSASMTGAPRPGNTAANSQRRAKALKEQVTARIEPAPAWSRTTWALPGAIGISRGYRSQQGGESCLLKMPVAGQCLRQTFLAHHCEGYAVGQRPFLVGALEIKAQPSFPASGIWWYYPNSLLRP